MKRTYLAHILILLTVFTTTVTADDAFYADTSDMGAASVVPMQLDPTLAFFSAMSTCTPGSYTEKNIISTEVGPAMLNQTIVGFNEDGSVCNAILVTPDNRHLTCAFPKDSLNIFNDQHFLQGMLAGTTDSPSQDSINADMTWSQMKEDHCSFSE